MRTGSQVDGLLEGVLRVLYWLEVSSSRVSSKLDATVAEARFLSWLLLAEATRLDGIDASDHYLAEVGAPNPEVMRCLHMAGLRRTIWH